MQPARRRNCPGERPTHNVEVNGTKGGAAGVTASELRTVGRPAVVSVEGSANGQVSHANRQVSRANGQVPHANGAPAQASFAQALSKKVGVATAVPPFSAQLRPNATAAAIVPPTLTMNGVSHGVVVGATANGPPCVAPTEKGSIHDSSPLPQYVATVNRDALHTVLENRVNTVPQEVLQAIDIVLRHGPSIRLTPVGRSFFKPPLPNQAHSVGGGREVWFGYYTSVRPDQWKRMLNVDMSATTFYEPEPVISFMCKILSDGRRERTLADFRGLRDFKNVTHLPYPRKYKVVRVTKEPAKNLFFDIEDGSRCSVADYFQNHYGRLVYPNLLCIQVGNLAHPVYLPLEVCEIVEGQHCRKKLDENQTSEMIKRTAQPPAKHFSEIRQSVRDLVGSNDQCLREFNIKISTEPTQLKGWVLEPPSLVFENNAVTKPYEGT
ncbi:hypothetical protein HPB51_008658 [Rhipicephalus microplus]|uniref:PAZ domain-containing protein n=1 Tax=Rhipicephalus microplus TaxID=6941 RepID=A0A9J6EFK5_RHIMP|nr:hypothetical protein HPB51_008658 [Rhipicephalus microplus]